jgi:hypothetical protein
MNKLITLLASLNRKERFFLVGNALDNPDFTLGEVFRKKLECKTRLTIPPDAWVAMDYHIDWLAAAIHVTTNDFEPSDPWKNIDPKIVEGTQEDVDLIVGFGTTDQTTLILIEAKGVTAWSKTQMESKSERLVRIFGDDGKKVKNVSPVYVLTSPKRPDTLDTSSWPTWMTRDGTPIFIPLNITEGRRQLTRTDGNKKAVIKMPPRPRS